MSIAEKFKNQREKNELMKQKLLNGEFGLAKTFWLFWFLPIILLTIFETLEKRILWCVILDISMLILSAIIIKSILKTNGTILWKIVAIIFIAIDILIVFLALFTYF